MVQELMTMDQGWCDSAVAWRIQDGDSEGVNLGGRTVVLGIDFPGPTMFDGGATARLYIDDQASEEQRRELESIYHGSKGGTMGALAPLIANWLPTQSAAINVDDEGERISVSVGGAGQIESRLLKDGEGHGFELRGGGFVAGFGMEVALMAPSSSRWSDPELPRSFETKSGARGHFSWSA
jgi:hypothetical protein